MNKYKDYIESNFRDPSKLRRLYPKMRLSYSLYSWSWSRNNWNDVFSYLCSLPIEETEAMRRGSDIHFKMEIMGPPKEFFNDTVGDYKTEPFYELHATDKRNEEIIKEYLVAGKIDLLWLPYIADYKTGSSLGGVEDQMHCYKWMLNNEKYEIHEREFKNYTDKVIKPIDNITKGWGIMVGDNLVCDKKNSKLIYLDDKKVSEWEDKFDGMYSDILERIYNGELQEFMKLNNLEWQIK